MSGAGMLDWAVGNLVWASAAMLLVLAIRRPAASLFGAGIAYALWSIPLLRLLAPPGEWIAGWVAAPLPSLPPLLIVYGPGLEAATSVPVGEAVPWAAILLAVWAVGAAALLIAQAWLYRRLVAGIAGVAAGTHRGIAVRVSDGVDGPLALGLFRRRIVVPAGFFERYSPAERELALDHERFHHRRGDILANYVALVVLAANWFNPVAWAAFRAFRADQELSCDAAITATAEASARSDYARALVKSASRPGLVAVCPLNGADQLKRRLRMIARHRRDPRRVVAGGAVTILLGAASLASGAPAIAGAADLVPLASAPSWTPTFELADPPARSDAAPAAAVRTTASEAPAVTAPSGPAPTMVVLEPRTADGALPVAFAASSITLRRAPDGTFRAEGASPALARQIGECRDVAVQRDGAEGGRTIVVCAPAGSDHQAIGAAVGKSHAPLALNAAALRRARDGIAASGQLAGESRQQLIEQVEAMIAKAETP